VLKSASKIINTLSDPEQGEFDALLFSGGGPCHDAAASKAVLGRMYAVRGIIISLHNKAAGS
jgi:hypothetical protein